MRLGLALTEAFDCRHRVRIVLTGNLQSKKNQLRPTGGKHVYNRELKAMIEALTTQARIQWGPRKALAHPEVQVRIFVANSRKDVDGIWTTVCDCLKKAGVIHDDSIKWFNGRKTFEPATIVPAREERIEIVFTFDPPEKTR